MKNKQICSLSGESHAEEWANFLTHGFGLLISIAGVIFLIDAALVSGDPWVTCGCLIYGITLVLMYGSSTLYHGCTTHELKRYLRILDHICIYLLIAGSYTPLLFGPLREEVGLPLCFIIWGFAAIGIILKVFFTGRFVIMSTALYLFMGWLAIIIFDPLINTLSDLALMWLLAGGLFYTFGVAFFLWERLPYNHSIWHVFVIGGSLCHYCTILIAVP